jgi:hypothetical protein
LLTHPTLDQLGLLGLPGMAQAFDHFFSGRARDAVSATIFRFGMTPRWKDRDSNVRFLSVSLANAVVRDGEERSLTPGPRVPISDSGHGPQWYIVGQLMAVGG